MPCVCTTQWPVQDLGGGLPLVWSSTSGLPSGENWKMLPAEAQASLLPSLPWPRLSLPALLSENDLDAVINGSHRPWSMTLDLRGKPGDSFIHLLVHPGNRVCGLWLDRPGFHVCSVRRIQAWGSALLPPPPMACARGASRVRLSRSQLSTWVGTCLLEPTPPQAEP